MARHAHLAVEDEAGQHSLADPMCSTTTQCVQQHTICGHTMPHLAVQDVVGGCSVVNLILCATKQTQHTDKSTTTSTAHHPCPHLAVQDEVGERGLVDPVQAAQDGQRGQAPPGVAHVLRVAETGDRRFTKVLVGSELISLQGSRARPSRCSFKTIGPLLHAPGSLLTFRWDADCCTTAHTHLQLLRPAIEPTAARLPLAQPGRARKQVH